MSLPPQPPNETEELQHEEPVKKVLRLLPALLTKRSGIGRLEHRVGIIVALTKPQIERFLVGTFLDSSFKKDLESWLTKYRALDRCKRAWRVENVANSLCEFDTLINSVLNTVAVSKAVVPAAIKSFQDFMNGPVTDTSTLIEAEQDCTKKCTSTKRRNKVRVGEQKAGECIQGTLDITKIKLSDFDAVACARCGHSFLYALESAEAVEERNAKMKEDYEKEKKIWEKSHAQKRGSKPRIKKSDSQSLACMCIVTACNNKVTGAGCFVCKNACDAAKKNNHSTNHPFLDDKLQCTCVVCKCNCNAVYQRSQQFAVAQQAEDDKLKKKDDEKEDNNKSKFN